MNLLSICISVSMLMLTQVEIGSTTQLGTGNSTTSIVNSTVSVTGSSTNTVTSSALVNQSIKTTKVVTISILNSTLKKGGYSTSQAPGSTMQPENGKTTKLDNGGSTAQSTLSNGNSTLQPEIGTATKELNGFQIDEETDPVNGTTAKPKNRGAQINTEEVFQIDTSCEQLCASLNSNIHFNISSKFTNWFLEKDSIL